MTAVSASQYDVVILGAGAAGLMCAATAGYRGRSVLVPYWSERLGKTRLDARQISARGGVLRCELKGDRVDIAGQAAFYMEGSVHLA